MVIYVRCFLTIITEAAINVNLKRACKNDVYRCDSCVKK